MTMRASVVHSEQLQLPSRRLFPLVELGTAAYALYSFAGVAKHADGDGSLVSAPAWTRCPAVEGFYPRSHARLVFPKAQSKTHGHHHPYGEVILLEKGIVCIELTVFNREKERTIEWTIKRIILEHSEDCAKALCIRPDVPHRIVSLSDEAVVHSYTDSDSTEFTRHAFPRFQAPKISA